MTPTSLRARQMSKAEQMGSALLSELERLLPPDRLTTGPSAVAEYASDRSRQSPSAAALAVVHPESAAEVGAVLSAANRAGVSVVPQGARTGLVGGASALPGSLLLNLGRMNRIVRIDRVDRVAVVQPGVLVGDLQRAVEAQGLFYAPDPASADIASIGGTIATNAGGMRCLKYGVTRDWVRSLEIVLADGEIVRTRPETAKAVAALDLTSLIVGSEGTLAVVTEATVALRPAPGPTRGVVATFDSVRGAFSAAAALASGPRLPVTLEFLDDVALRGVRIVQPELRIAEQAQAWLLCATDEILGAGEDLDRYEATMRAHGASTIHRADDPADLTELLTARRALNSALNALRGSATHGDLAVPPSQLPALADAAHALASELGVEISLAGHVGDGNLHPTVVFDASDPREVAAAHEADRRLLALASRLGGTIAGEHGIGSVKHAAAQAEVAPRIRSLQRGVKAVFDPRGILNPGRKL